ncbi:MAG: hypothetical protein COU35_01665 [Candidatus Magasanikbacteria bacterium CG10_big_fil_rev_8_21_14_0_10_47_10]|uniref:SprT-like domain-containing protein n=1 Tax=Candidatus Magasanikbacteria bacterium CG10_big_fil_rev_8_21_14_0_10_47_10 TaxID=1974652 RepID=A0A2H0TT29_9BACT|nr:MAG: hypothetical protein COU35_01665 [Candidatus Magasanikbacteria bacterium CG10_big_fil_rev_8_21_14_0_10_47_10]
MSKLNYNKSNRIQKIKFRISDRAQMLTTRLLCSNETNLRQALSTDLLDELCDFAEIGICNAKISDAKQYHKKRNGRVSFKQYGYYKPGSKYIYINNRTAVRGSLLAPKTFVDTLLHEWMHHYDFEKLGLNSIHTAGFYARLKDIKEKLGYFDA